MSDPTTRVRVPWRRLALPAIAALLAAYLAAYVGASRVGYGLEQSRCVNATEFFFASPFGSPRTSPDLHRACVVAFAPLWLVELRWGNGRRPASLGDGLPFSIQEDGWGVSMTASGRWLRASGGEWLLAEQHQLRLRQWWDRHEPLSLPRPDAASLDSPSSHPRAHRLVVSAGESSLEFTWNTPMDWRDAEERRRAQDAILALEALTEDLTDCSVWGGIWRAQRRGRRRWWRYH